MGKRGSNNKKKGGKGNRRSGNTSTLVTGSQELQLITTGTPSGTFVGGQIPLIPTFEPGSRLSRVAVEYSQYNIESSRVTFNTSASTSTSGRIAFAWTFDPLESNPVSVHQIIQVARSKMGSLHKNLTTSMPRGAPEKRKFAVIEGPQFEALSTPDKLLYLPATLIFGTDNSAQSGLIVGSLVWHYRIRFFNQNLVIGAELLPIRTIAPPTTSQPAPSWRPLIEWSDDEDDGTWSPDRDDQAWMHTQSSSLPPPIAMDSASSEVVAPTAI